MAPQSQDGAAEEIENNGRSEGESGNDAPSATQPTKHSSSWRKLWDMKSEDPTAPTQSQPEDQENDASTQQNETEQSPGWTLAPVEERTSPDTETGDRPMASQAQDSAAEEIESNTLSGGGGGNEIPPRTPPAKRSSSRLPIALAAVALIVAGFAAWQTWSSADNMRAKLAARLAESDESISEARVLIRQHQENIAAMQGKIGALEAQVAASSGQAAALETLYQELFRSRSDRVLAEVEQAINIAAQQLQLAGNIDAALVALQGAEARLGQPDQGHLQMLRIALLKDIDSIKNSPRADISGLALKLEILLERVDRLPLAHALTLKENQDEQTGEAKQYVFDYRQPMVFLRALGSDAWKEIRSLVRIENMDDANPVLLAPQQSVFLRENVKIRLLTARLALLARDGRTYSSDLAQARGWIEKYFDSRNENVQRVVADLAELEQKDIKTGEFSLTESFAALRTLQARPNPQSGGEDVPPGLSTTNSY